MNPFLKKWQTLSAHDRVLLSFLVGLMVVQMFLVLWAFQQSTATNAALFSATYPRLHFSSVPTIRPPIVAIFQHPEPTIAEISGSDFDCSLIRVFFGTSNSTVISCSGNRIVSIVPPSPRPQTHYNFTVRVYVGHIPPGKESSNATKEFLSTELSSQDAYFTYYAARNSNVTVNENENVAIAWISSFDLHTQSVIRIFLARLDNNWLFDLYAPQKVATDLRTDPDISYAIGTGRMLIHTKILGQTATKDRYERALITPAFWSSVRGRRALLFSETSVLCSHSAKELKDFYKYEYVGSPWCRRAYLGGSGGLSLRNKDAMIDILNTSADYFESLRSSSKGFAGDVRLSKLGTKDKRNFAPRSAAAEFSVESIYHDAPVGVSKPWLWLDKKDLVNLVHSCPELRYILPHDNAPYGTLQLLKKCLPLSTPVPRVSYNDLKNDLID